MEIDKSWEEKLDIGNTSLKNHSGLQKCDCDYVYFKVIFLKNSPKTESNEDPVFLKNGLLKSLANYFGEINSLVPVDVIKYDDTTNELILRCNSMIFPRLSSSILLNYPNSNCFRIHNVSYNNPMCLKFSSRSYRHCSKKNKKRKTQMSLI